MMLSKIKQARSRIEELRGALLSPAPEEICAALPGLEEAVCCMQTVEREIREGSSPPEEVRQELKLLKNDLRISVRLIEHGMAFCQGWAKMIGSGTAYTQAGHPAPPEQLGRVALSLQG